MGNPWTVGAKSIEARCQCPTMGRVCYVFDMGRCIRMDHRRLVRHADFIGAAIRDFDYAVPMFQNGTKKQVKGVRQ